MGKFKQVIKSLINVLSGGPKLWQHLYQSKKNRRLKQEIKNGKVIFITNDNFDQFTRFHKKQPYTGNLWGAEKVADHIEITTNFLAAPAIYYYHHDNQFCFCNSLDHILLWCRQHHFHVPQGRFFLTGLSDEDYHVCAALIGEKMFQFQLPAIENYAKIKIFADGIFEKTDYPLKPFTVDIQDNYEAFQHFLQKHRDCVLQTINDGKFIPTITGGLDTRTLIGLYRDKIPQLKNYLQAPYKRNTLKRYPKQTVIAMGKMEQIIARQVATRIGLPGQKIQPSQFVGKYVTLCGKYNDVALNIHSINHPDFVYKVIQHAPDKTFAKIYPFTSDEFLQFKQERNVTRCLMALLLVPDLLDIPLISNIKSYLGHPHGYDFYEYYAEPIQRAREIMDAWGPEKCQKLVALGEGCVKIWVEEEK